MTPINKSGVNPTDGRKPSPGNVVPHCRMSNYQKLNSNSNRISNDYVNQHLYHIYNRSNTMWGFMCCYTDAFRTPGRGKQNVVNKRERRLFQFEAVSPVRKRSEKGSTLDPGPPWASAARARLGPPLFIRGPLHGRCIIIIIIIGSIFLSVCYVPGAVVTAIPVSTD